MKVLLLLFVTFYSLFSLDLKKIEFSSHSIANGKSLLLEFGKEDGVEYKSVAFAGKSFQIFQNPTNRAERYALLPISYYPKTENKTLSIKYIEDAKVKYEELLVKIVDGNYQKEEIHVSKEKVNPQDKKVKERVSREYKEAMKIYNTVSIQSYIKKPFILPIESTITSNFGKARTYNGSLKGYHSGTDFRAKTGTAIAAANDGKVVLVKNRFYSGGTILIDHGEGIYTCYFHMSSFNVKKGEIVQRGQVIGLSGQSGRVTGPHLHFSARINGVQVDPLQLITLINEKLLKGKKET